VPGASHLYVGYLDEHLAKIKADLARKDAVAVVCSVGHRAGLATSILRRHGFKAVCNVLGGMTAWEKLELPLEKGAERSVTTPDIEGIRK
jgi:hydroxyacylglutathione hydrolase